MFNNITFLSFSSFIIGITSCIFIYIFKFLQSNKEKSNITNYYELIKQADIKFIEAEYELLKNTNKELLDYFKTYQFNYLKFLQANEQTYNSQVEPKITKFVRHYISCSLVTLYIVAIILLLCFSIRYDKQVFLIFLESSILNYLIQLVSIIVSFTLTQKILFGIKE